MNKKLLLALLVLLVIVCAVGLFFAMRRSRNVKNGFVIRHCYNHNIPPIELDLLRNKYNAVDGEHNWNIWFPCGYTNIEAELAKNNFFNEKGVGSLIMGLVGTDNFAAKDRLWKVLSTFYGREGACDLAPQTWVTYDAADKKHFKEYTEQNGKDGGKLFIAKKNIQRQDGLHIFSDPSEMDTALQKSFVIVQDVLLDPFRIDGRKTNFRVYVLLVFNSNTGDKSMYVYRNGFVYYTNKDKDVRSQVITTGYIDRQVYIDNPLTLEDFYVHLDKTGGSSSNFLRLKRELFRKVMAAFVHTNSFGYNKGGGGTYASIFGADVQLNSDATSLKLIEMNKGPDLITKDVRDDSVKREMIHDCYDILMGSGVDSENGFTQVW